MKFLSNFLFLPMLFLLAISGRAEPANTRPLSLNEALALSSEGSYQLHIARQQLAEAKGQNLKAWRGFLPHFTITERYLKTDDPVSVFGLKLKQGVFSQQDFGLSALNDPDKFENYTTEFRVELPILNLDAIFGKSAATMMVKAQRQGVQRAKEAVAFQTKSAYYGLILSYQSLRAIEQAIKSAQAHRDDAKAALDQGMISEADYLAAEVRLGELQEQKISAANQIRNVSDGLKLIMGMASDEVLFPTDSLTISGSISADANTQAALENRADLRAILFQKKAAGRNLWAKGGAWLPRINGFGIREWNGADAFQKDASNFTLGVQLSWNIFDGFGHLGRRQQAAAKKHQADVRYRRAMQQARNEIAAARRNLQAAQQRIAVAQKAVRQATESLHITEQRFREGLAKTADLLDREAMQTNARLRFLKAKHDYLVAASELDFALGE